MAALTNEINNRQRDLRGHEDSETDRGKRHGMFLFFLFLADVAPFIQLNVTTVDEYCVN